jgi:glutathione synthase/RimK-type ligase-like ATP-grasp enzyme
MIVRCYSSAVNYIHDIRTMRFEPVLMEPYIEDEQQRAEIRADYAREYKLNGDACPRVIYEKETYDKTLEMVRELDPLLILPGSDNGVLSALRLSKDLGLKSNSCEHYSKMRDKYGMQMALRDHGLAYTYSEILNTEEEAVSFYRRMEGTPVVLKITQSSATVGVYICDTEEEVIRAYHLLREMLRMRDSERKGERLIAQEYLEGQEFAIDTVSCGGRHIAVYGWKYKKERVLGYGTIYDRCMYISPDEKEYDDIVEYVFRCLDAIGIQYGPVHAEVIRTSEGPVLVEVNCRPGGGEQKYSYQDKFMHEHETMIALHSYLMEPGEFFNRYPERMRLKQYAASKDIRIKEKVFIERPRLTEACSQLPTFEYAVEPEANRVFEETRDLSSHGGTIYLTGTDNRQLEEDLDYITYIEQNHPERLYVIRK